MRDELKRFREREPLVKELIGWIGPGDPETHGQDELPKFWRGFVAGLDDHARKVQSFCVSSASAAEAVKADAAHAEPSSPTK
jgi:hypothetical protein